MQLLFCLGLQTLVVLFQICDLLVDLRELGLQLRVLGDERALLRRQVLNLVLILFHTGLQIQLLPRQLRHSRLQLEGEGRAKEKEGGRGERGKGRREEERRERGNT